LLVDIGSVHLDRLYEYLDYSVRINKTIGNPYCWVVCIEDTAWKARTSYLPENNLAISAAWAMTSSVSAGETPLLN